MHRDWWVKKSVYTAYAQYTYRDNAVLEAVLRIR